MHSGRLTGLKINDHDNVATLFCNACPGFEVEIQDRQGEKTSMTVIDDIPYGHKTALVDIGKGQAIVKYGEQIGIATDDIRIGQHIHVHNMESTRGRGDWEREVRS